MITQAWTPEQIEVRNRATKSPGFFRPPASEKNQSIQYELSARPDRVVSGRVYPNGEFGVGFVPPRGITAEDCRYESDRRYAEENAEIIADIEIDDDSPEGYRYIRTKHLPSPPKLGIGSELSQPRGKYGLNGITSYGRKIIRNAGYLIDVACEGRYNRLPQMGTLTVPSYSPDTMERICSNWSNIVKRFFQECKRQYRRHRYEFDYASVTEIQPQRLAARSEVGLHLHFLFVAIRLGKNKWVLSDTWVRRVWQRILETYLGSQDVCQLPNYRRDSVRHSSAAYLAKYASKGCDLAREVAQEYGEQFIPSQWWSVSSGLRRAIRRHSILSSTVVADILLCICTQDMKEYYRYKRTVTLTIPTTDYAKAHNCPSEVVLGYGGLLSTDGCRLIQPPDMHQSIKSYLGRTLDTSRRS